MWVRLPPRPLLMPKPKLPDKDFEWTSELAYAVGLLTTDGCLSNDGRHIVLRSSDKDLLQTFKRCLNLKNRIGRTVNGRVVSYRVQFGSVQFYRWLLKIGLFPHKTYTIGTLNIPDQYFRDFLRGHLDGDGSITVYRDSYNAVKMQNPKYVYTRLFVRFISASKKHMIWLRENIVRLLGVHGALHESRPPADSRRVSLWLLKFMKKESLELLSQLYYDPAIPCLERKRKIVEAFYSRA